MDIEIFMKHNRYVIKLKDIIRTGWVRSGISGGESVAEHIYHTAVNTLILRKIFSDIPIDWDKLLVMALVHDLSEAITGDIPTYEKSMEDRRREESILKNILNEFGYPPEWSSEIIYHDGLEGSLLRFIDLISTVYQAIKYIEDGYCSDYLRDIILNSLDEIDSLVDKLGYPQLVNIASFLKGYAIGYLRRCKG